ncbi:MAG: hypothetical protein NDI61_05035 [Bdellovibrionaceae bacterium]|nr:hypothetical protein [Pseudobdellovibrionaceae bacterium]
MKLLRQSHSFAALLVVTGAFMVMTAGSGCTSDGNGHMRPILVQQKAQATACESDEIRFDSALSDSNSEAVDAASLPPGLYLYSRAEMRVEKSVENANPAHTIRMLVSESPGTEAIRPKVECVTRAAGEKVESSLNGLTKIEVRKSGTSEVTVRQFQAFVRDDGHGLVALNPRLLASPVSSLADFMKAYSGTAKLIKIGPRAYAMRIDRDVDGVRSQLLIHYDFIARD